MSTITLRSPETAIASLPYLLGYTPQRSLVTVTNSQHGGAHTVGLTARVDLPRPGEDLDAFMAEYRQSVLAAMQRVPNASSVAVFVVDDTPAGPGSMTYRELAEQVSAEAQAVGEVIDVLYTDGDTYRSYLCQDPSCGCMAGAQISQSAKDSVAAQFVAAGVAPAASRAQLEQSWHAPDDPQRLELVASWCSQADQEPLVDGYDTATPTDRAAAQLAAGAQVVDTLTGPAPLSPEQQEQLVRVLTKANTDIRLRDAVLWSAAMAPVPAQRTIAEHLTHLGAAMPVEHREAIATVAATARYLAGDGAQANIAVEQALTANPDARMAGMLETALAAGVPPQQYASMMQSMSPQQAVGLSPLPQNTPAPSVTPPAPVAAV